MTKSTVALIRCNDYSEDRVFNTVVRGINLLGGASKFAKPDDRIVLKPNVLFGIDPQKCVTTHPSVFKAAARIFQETGAKLSFGDSPGFGRCEFSMARSGLKQPADELGIPVADFDNGRTVTHKTALLSKQFIIANGVTSADGVISLPKLKAHGLTRLTGAVKNQFGCIPGLAKLQYHLKMANPYDFATMLVDLNTFIKPRLYIMDGIIAMEGNGPRNGEPRELHVLLFSSDPVALDAIACKIIDLNPEFVPTSKPGEKAGLGTYHYENIELIGDPVDSFVTADFDVVRKPPVSATGGRIRTFLKNQMCPRPVISAAKCTRCGTCVKVCPVDPKAVDWISGDKSRIPVHNYIRCIRCYCCQELCPEGAISIKNTLMGTILFH